MTKNELYIAANREISIRLDKGGDFMADLGNIIAVLKKRLLFYWVGIYFLRDNRLVLGPFQGNPACVFLTLDHGVCARCVKEGRTIIVPDVHKFSGHVACDPLSRSEIVVPFFARSQQLAGVIDVDSDTEAAFDKTDQENLEHIAALITQLLPAEA